ncbi:RNA ligase family protein [Nocardia sp. NPDC052566]|uniref:RNA ligase family protein n=1 Tax=Nocardia sp. NPDC052566 TaxID=3364330 RepID=UPI0037CC7D2D
MNFRVREVDLAALNTLTKYPSIQTYHALDPRNGRLVDDRIEFDGPVIGTEKVDGTNARIISLPGGGYILGSREELLYAKGDLIGNPAQGIVAALRGPADALGPMREDVIEVRYLEVYGAKITAGAKEYTGTRAVGFRLFDHIRVPDYADLLARPRAVIAEWRESGGQRFLAEPDLLKAAADAGIDVTPRLFTLEAAALPTGIDEMRAFLRAHLPRTRSALDAGAGGKPEGIVLRTGTRSRIAKARFQDYDRTLRGR